MDDSDPILVAGLVRGDPAAFDRVFARDGDVLWRFLVRLCGRREVAEELLQDAFLALARHARRLRPDTRLRAWLFTVARNRWRSHRRWAWLDGRRLAEVAARVVGVDAVTPYDALTAARAGARFEHALAALPEKNREVAILVIVERLEPAEVAALLGLTPEAVRQRLARARQALATSLDGGSP